MSARVPAEVLAAYNLLDEPGRLYLLGWLVGAITDEGQATVATLEAAMPHAVRWGERWSA